MKAHASSPRARLRIQNYDRHYDPHRAFRTHTCSLPSSRLPVPTVRCVWGPRSVRPPRLQRDIEAAFDTIDRQNGEPHREVTAMRKLALDADTPEPTEDELEILFPRDIVDLMSIFGVPPLVVAYVMAKCSYEVK